MWEEEKERGRTTGREADVAANTDAQTPGERTENPPGRKEREEAQAGVREERGTRRPSGREATWRRQAGRSPRP